MKPIDPRATGPLIAERRKELGLSQAELANRLHITDKAVSKWETGRSLPGVDSLEPLAEALGLSVSELLRGQRLTPEELPKTAGEQVVDGLRKSRLRLWQGVIAALLAVALVYGVYCGYHYAISVPADDKAALTSAMVRYQNSFQYKDSFDYSAAQLMASEQRGNYLAALFVDGSAHFNLCIYERDICFPERWCAVGGQYSPKYGRISIWNYGGPGGNTVIAVAGWGLPQKIRYYSFEVAGITYTVSLQEHPGYILNLFVLQDSSWHVAHDFQLLDAEKNLINYHNPYEPDVTQEEFGP